MVAFSTRQIKALFFSLFGLICLDKSLAQVNLTNGLVAHYPFNGNANDASGNNHNGQLMNGVNLTTDRFGNPNSAYMFDGVNDYIRVTDNGGFSTPSFSLALWFQSETDALQNLVGKRGFAGGNNGAQYQFFINYSPFPGIGSNIVGNTSNCTNITSSSYINTGDVICRTKWYFAVITLEPSAGGARHKIYIDGVLKKDQPASFTGMLTSCLSELRFGNWWSGDLIPFKGKMDDIRWYNRVLNQDEVTALYGSFPTSSSADFSYSQNSCSPRTIQFTNLTPNSTSVIWNFGNNTTNTGNPSPTVTYATFGNYNVKLRVQTSSGCVDSVTKLIPVLVQQDSMITKADTTICLGSSVQLNTLPSLNYCWGAEPGLSNTNITNPIATPSATTTYYFTAQAAGINLVINGDFSAGNTGFTSDYSPQFPNTTEAVYSIGNNPNAWNAAFNPCTEHTTGTGNMMMVNGSPVAGAKVWSQTVAVTPNTNYAFGVWIQSLASLNPANLRFSINGNTLGNNIGAGNTACQWSRFYTTWNSGNNTSAVITIVNNNTIAAGNDFAIDDISFSQVYLRQDSIKITVVNSIPPDFSFTQSTCDPKTIQFSNITPGTGTFLWNFGNGNTNSSNQSPTITYSNFGNYNVTLDITGGCNGTITKTIPVLLQQDSLITKADTTICRGSSVQLGAFPSLDFCWGNAAGLNNTTITNPLATPVNTTTYYFTSKSAGNNLVANGDFSGGNTGFTSDYVSIFPNTAEAQYWVGADPNTWWPTFPSCGDHTTGTGNMLMVNGSQTVGAKVWQQTVTVTPNTNYAFSTWIKSLHTTSPANLKFSINSNTLGNNILASSSTCVWQQYYATWNSGSNTTAVINIINNNTAFNGNDFALDDISFAQVFLKRDSIKINVTDEPDITVAPNASICPGESVPLNATGASNFSWTPSATLSNPNIANPMAMPTVTTKYFVNGYDLPGCVGKDSVVITVKDTPVISRITDTGFCKGSSPIIIFASAPNATQYTWTPAAGLSDANISNPLANPVNTQVYYVTILGSNGCKSRDSVKVAVLDLPTVNVRSDTSICLGVQTPLTTTTSGVVTYNWSPGTGLSDPNTASPLASPLTQTKYILTVSNGACTEKDSVTIDVKPSPIVTTSNDTTICNQGQALLFATGGINYQWFPSAGLNNSNVSNPVASPTAPMKYYVKVTGINGCDKTDSVNVGWQPKPVFAINPLSIAICIGDSTALTASGADTYNWFAGTNILSPNAASTIVHPAATQQFAVAVRHMFCGLNDTLRSTVTVNDLPTASVSKSNDIDCSNASATLSATGGVAYSWFPQTAMSGGNTPTPVVTPGISTTYFVNVSNANGCTDTDSIRVNVLFNPTAGGYNMPDAFTPNNDSKNDCFGLKYWGLVQDLDFSVFDRWGVRVFHTSNSASCWDGTYKGIPQASGTYVYQIKAKTACGDVFKKGTVILMR